MSEIKQQLQADMKTAMKAGEKAKLQTIRSINAAIKQREVDERIELQDNDVLAILEKLAKQRKDSLTQFEDAGREDLAVVEREELAIIQTYLPQQLEQSEVEAIIRETVAEVGATEMKDMGQVMAVLKPKLAGRADMGKVSGLVKQAISG